MTSFIKGMTFTMGGKEYEVVAEGSSDPSSCMVYVPCHEKETADPQSIRIWKAEAKLARGDIMISGYTSDRHKQEAFFPTVVDPLQQIAELKRRIHAIEQRRISLLKADDPASHVLLQDNVVRPNKQFDIWQYTRTSGDIAKRGRTIQFIKIRGLVLSLAATATEYFLFNIADQLQPCCKVSGDTLTSEGKIKLDLTPELHTVKGTPTRLLTLPQGMRMELTVETALDCKFASGLTMIQANILQFSCLRNVNAPKLRFQPVPFPEQDYSIGIEGVCIDVYTEEPGK